LRKDFKKKENEEAKENVSDWRTWRTPYPMWDEEYEARARRHYEQMERIYWERRYNTYGGMPW
jgi:hypothetical protein